MEVASRWGASRRTVHRQLAHYEAEGLQRMPDRSHGRSGLPTRCPPNRSQGARDHQALADAPPVSRFHAAARTLDDSAPRPDPTGEHWVARRVSTVGVDCVGYQQDCIRQSYASSACDVLVTDGTLDYWVGNELVKTEARQTKGEIRKNHADWTAPTRARSAWGVKHFNRTRFATEQPKVLRAASSAAESGQLCYLSQ
jgi:leucine-zipper of insertion element IS481